MDQSSGPCTPKTKVSSHIEFAYASCHRNRGRFSLTTRTDLPSCEIRESLSDDIWVDCLFRCRRAKTFLNILPRILATMPPASFPECFTLALISIAVRIRCWVTFFPHQVSNKHCIPILALFRGKQRACKGIRSATKSFQEYPARDKTCSCFPCFSHDCLCQRIHSNNVSFVARQ